MLTPVIKLLMETVDLGDYDAPYYSTQHTKGWLLNKLILEQGDFPVGLACLIPVSSVGFSALLKQQLKNANTNN